MRDGGISCSRGWYTIILGFRKYNTRMQGTASCQLVNIKRDYRVDFRSVKSVRLPSKSLHKYTYCLFEMLLLVKKHINSNTICSERSEN